MKSPKTTGDENLHRATASPAAGRRKGTATRLWLVIPDSGRSYTEEVGKQSIMRRTGLPARDLRVLDPLLSYPSTILGRERAILINLEHIKAIITATEVLVSNSKDPLVASFVQDLQCRISDPLGTSQKEREGGDVDGEVMAKTTSRWSSFPGHDGSARKGERISQQNLSSETTILGGELPKSNSIHALDAGKDGATKMLPFEFRALEACLESACQCLESEASTLEQEAYPALDELTSKISTLNLERVRQIKSRLVAISGRVQKVRDELENLLDDDMDMAEMYLTEKLFHQPAGETSSLVDDAFEQVVESDDDYKNEAESIHESLGCFKPNIEELEMLLEAYFVQIDGALNKLSTLREYVDDTEDYINIMLDDKQNQLLQMGLMLSTATLILTSGVVIVGIFGINIHIPLFESPYPIFWKTTSSVFGGCIFLYMLAVVWGKKSGLLR